MKHRWATALLAAGLLSGGTVAADDRGFYLGGSALWSHLRNTTAGTKFDGSEVGYKVFMGYQFARLFGVETAYNDFGNFSETQGVTTQDADVRNLVIYGRGIFPIGNVFEVGVKLGVAYTEADVVVTDLLDTTESSSSDTDLGWGVGVGARLGKRVVVRGEFESYETSSFQTIEAVSLGAQFKF